MSDDSQSPDKSRGKGRTPADSAPVKVINGRVAKTKPATASKKAPARAKKATVADPVTTPEAKPARTRKAAGNTRLRKTVALKKKELEALQAGSLHDLDARQAKFVDIWLVTQNATQAYLDAGYKCKSDAVAAAAASRLLKKVKEHPYTQAKRAELFAKTEEITNRVIEKVYGAAMADPRELVEYVYKCCRYCHGIEHRYQMTPRQMDDRKEAHAEAVAEAKREKRRLPEFDELGGVGYDATRDPHENCPECHGVGIGMLVLKDTRHLSPGALALYGGVKQTKDGLEVKISDQRPFLELLGRLFNMNIEPAVPPTAPVDAAALDAAYAAGLAKTNMQREAMTTRAAEIAALDDEGGDA
ncbi:terminase small subunit [Pseudomonas sp. NPDC090208]|uniref:terminase small subunit n=1 Tax=Pseudomonas sp. NPDC090208 TaxID=3364478 RepID=UPI003823BBD8